MSTADGAPLPPEGAPLPPDGAPLPPDGTESSLHEITEIVVAGSRPSPVLVGRGNRFEVGATLPPGVERVLIVHPPTLAAAAAQLLDSFGAGYTVLLAEIPDAESAKRVEVAAFCWQILGQANFTRSDAIVGFGGGAVTDLAGFVAATWLRGVALIQIPTTLLGMVDAAIGGKTGINTAEGKNLVGSFYAPWAVIVDLETLETLGANEIIAGFGEVVKYGFIAEPQILDLIEADQARATDPSSREFRRIVELCIGIKANVVGDDFTEKGGREMLNYGHTLGHAIEHAERYQWRHGAAVSVGMMYVAELARLSGRLSDAVADRHRSILESLGLPTSYPAGRWETLLATMQRDKKARGSLLRFVVLDDIARPTIMAGPDSSLMFAAYQEIAS